MAIEQDAGSSGELLSLAEATRYLGISRATLSRMLAQGDISGLRVGRQWRFRMSDLMNFTMRRPHDLSPAAVADLAVELAAVAGQLTAIGSCVPSGDPGDVDPGFARVIALCNAMVALAIDSRASDIHMEPQEIDGAPRLLTRIRVDGVLSTLRTMPGRLAEPIIDRFKLMAGLDLGERKQPQSGVIPVERADRKFQLSVATLPTTLGEALTVGVSSQIPRIPTLDDVDLSGEQWRELDSLMLSHHGLVVFAGSAGSGKTTTMFAAVREVAREQVRTITIETTPSYDLPFSSRVQVNTRAGLGYAAAIRAAMRQDPDILVLGEIADAETLDAAVEAALAGHLVFAVEGSPNAVAAMAHLRDMAGSGSRLSDALVGVVAQCLLRRVCSDCVVPDADPDTVGIIAALAEGLGIVIPTAVAPVRATGCPACRMTGYRRRTAIYEIVTVGNRLRRLLRSGAAESELIQEARGPGAGSLQSHGLDRVCQGVTTLEELVRTLGLG